MSTLICHSFSFFLNPSLSYAVLFSQPCMWISLPARSHSLETERSSIFVVRLDMFFLVVVWTAIVLFSVALKARMSTNPNKSWRMCACGFHRSVTAA